MEVDTCAPAFAPRNNLEVGNSGTYTLIDSGDRCAIQGRSDDLSLALTYAPALRNHGEVEAAECVRRPSPLRYPLLLGCSGASGRRPVAYVSPGTWASGSCSSRAMTVRTWYPSRICGTISSFAAEQIFQQSWYALSHAAARRPTNGFARLSHAGSLPSNRPIATSSRTCRSVLSNICSETMNARRSNSSRRGVGGSHSSTST